MARLAPAGLLLGLPLLAGCRDESSPGPPRAEPAGGVLVLTLDTTRRDAMGFHGRAPSVTPNLDRLAAESVVFDDAYTVAPLTLPAHASLLTGLYPFSHRLRDNSIAALAPEAVTLAEVLAEHGYATGAAVAAYVLDSCYGLDQGFATYRDVERDPAQASLFIHDVPADRAVDRALEDLGRMKAPFLYWLHLYDPHYPYEPPGAPPFELTSIEAVRAQKRERYALEIAFVDREVGRLLEALRARPDFDRLTLVVAADHGESLGDGVEPTHGWLLYDPTMRIPLLIRSPSLPPRRVAGAVSLVDVMPTLLDLLGIERPDLAFDGRGVLGQARGADSDEDGPRALVLESWYGWANFGWAPLDGCVHGSLKFVRGRRERLFDRASDPLEKRDVLLEDPARARGLRQRLDALLAEPAAALSTTEVPITKESLEAMQALGYLEPSHLDLAARPDVSGLEDPEDHMQLVYDLETLNQAIYEQRYEEAARWLRELCAVAPRSAMVHEQLGQVLLLTRDPAHWDEAERALRAALDVSFNRSRAHSDLALLAERRMAAARAPAEAARLRALAIAEYRLALGIDANSPKLLANLARLLWLEQSLLPPGSEAQRRALLDEGIGCIEGFLRAVAPDQADRGRMLRQLDDFRRLRGSLQ
jgi:arylsulfatase A-like enzyme